MNKITEKELLQSQLLYCGMAGKGFCPYDYDNGKCKNDCKCTNHIIKI